MIDSSLGKILSTKPVEPSISSNVDTNVTTSDTPAIEAAPISTTKEDSEPNPTRSEAEVRLVVRFLVEEHIVFNGKVEQVKHLDKTELSRIVSRIAWDGAKGENNELAIENEVVVDDVENTVWIEGNSEHKNCCEPSAEISPPQSDPPTPLHNNIDMIRPIDEGSTNIIEEQPYLTTNDTSSSSPDEVVPNNNEEGTTSNDERLLEDVKDNNTPECDNKTTTFISKDICETTKEQTESSYNIQENGNQHQMKDVASKRIRRVSSKDRQRNYRGTSRTAENLVFRKDKAIHSGPVVDEDSGYFACHSKVLAKWTDNHFYPGTISKQKGDRKFEVTFLDGARKDIAETDLFPVCNILGKQVRISIAEGYCVNAVVLDQLQNNGQPMFDVEYHQNGLVKKRVPLGDIFLTAEQATPLINQPIKPDKNPDGSMFAGVDLDNIVHVKRSRRLQEMEDFEPAEEL